VLGEVTKMISQDATEGPQPLRRDSLGAVDVLAPGIGRFLEVVIGLQAEPETIADAARRLSP
jgi:hypothetical protein